MKTEFACDASILPLRSCQDRNILVINAVGSQLYINCPTYIHINKGTCAGVFRLLCEYRHQLVQFQNHRLGLLTTKL